MHCLCKSGQVQNWVQGVASAVTLFLLAPLLRHEKRQPRLVEYLLHLSPRHVKGQLFGLPLQLLDHVVFPCNEESLIVLGIDSEPDHLQVPITGRHDGDGMTCRDDENITPRETGGHLLVPWSGAGLHLFFLFLLSSPLALPPLSREMRAGHFHFPFSFDNHAQDGSPGVVMRHKYRPLRIIISHRHFIKHFRKKLKKHRNCTECSIFFHLFEVSPGNVNIHVMELLVVFGRGLVEFAVVVRVQRTLVAETDRAGRFTASSSRWRCVLCQSPELLLWGSLDEAWSLQLPSSLALLSDEPLYLIFRGLQVTLNKNPKPG